MGKRQEGLLDKVKKGITTIAYHDDVDTASGQLVIDRLRSLSGENGRESANTGGARSPLEEPVTMSEPSYSADPTPAEGPASEEMIGTRSVADPVPDLVETKPPQAAALSAAQMGTILIVEDEIVTQRLLRMILEERGYEVVVAEDGVDALMALGKIKFDLILSDINMPNLDGFKLIEYLNKKDILIPVIFLTVRDDAEDEIRGLALGARDYIKKPIHRDLLLLRIRKALTL